MVVAVLKHLAQMSQQHGLGDFQSLTGEHGCRAARHHPNGLIVVLQYVVGPLDSTGQDRWSVFCRMGIARDDLNQPVPQKYFGYPADKFSKILGHAHGC